MRQREKVMGWKESLLHLAFPVFLTKAHPSGEGSQDFPVSSQISNSLHESPWLLFWRLLLLFERGSPRHHGDSPPQKVCLT